MKAVGIIPARYDSTRLPGKPLADIAGKTMIRRVYERATKCTALEKVVVATDNEQIFNEIKHFGGNVLMTSSRHQNGTERCAEAAKRLFEKEECIVVNIQGDEPFIDPNQITLLVDAFKEPEVLIATLVRPFHNEDEKQSASRVKAYVNKQFFAVTFSRHVNNALLNGDYQVYKHIGLYAYRSAVLHKIVTLTPTDLEISEKLEQLRWLYHGYPIRCVLTEGESISVDTPEDLEAARHLARTIYKEE
ncbi:MAG: 3-deoxy-manno-octulosonate cytidylyltransferase [Chitinophagales bacterium]|nr:3-deoxy-manno-octulosonate cytidylyltransferase [Chitinophagales bacterium]MDW8419184.1 3-deoxy-manno-octulosonate cytidylyltransferase [Chitinophagales bacterium]